MEDPSAERIEQNDLFSGIPLSLLASFLEAGEERTYPERVLLIQEGNESEGFFYIVEGEVHVVKDDDQYIDALQSGECVGEMSLFSSDPASASIVSNGTVTVYYFPRETVNEFIENKPKFAIPFFKNLLNRMSHRLRRTTNALSTVRKRTESLLEDEFSEIFASVDWDHV